MKITPEIIRQEFIGTDAKIVESTHFNYEGLTGKIVNETRDTFALQGKDKTRVVAKDSCIFCFKLSDDSEVEINGKLLVGAPEDRLKKNVRRLW